MSSPIAASLGVSPGCDALCQITKRGHSSLKDYYDMGDSANSLYLAIFSDTVNVPKTRVYQLATGGWYPLTNGPQTTTLQPTTILGQVSTPLVENSDPNSEPPIISGAVVSGGTTQVPGITANNNFLIANCIVLPTASDGTENWNYFGPGTSHISMTIQNCLMEHTRWVFCAGGDSCTFNFIGDYFVNMNGQPTRRNGGVYDGFANDDTMLRRKFTITSWRKEAFTNSEAISGRELFLTIIPLLTWQAPPL